MKKFKLPLGLSFIFLGLIPYSAFAENNQFCLYPDKDGKILQTNYIDNVPVEARSIAKCFTGKQDAYLAKPEEIDLKGTVRREDISSSVGVIHLRWPRSTESLFGRTPLRAMTDAAQTVSRALRSSGFPTNIASLNLEWQVIFLDEKLPETQIPAQLISNCHPGWMTPPANIYIVGQRVAAGCSSNTSVNTSAADSEMARVLVHEMGHAVEHYLLEGKAPVDRMRAEGFASWFSQYASRYSSIMGSSELKKLYYDLAKQDIQRSPNYFNFDGSAYSYARASMYFNAVVERRNLNSLMEVYKTMIKDKVDLVTAINKRLGWNEEKINKEITYLLEKK